MALEDQVAALVTSTTALTTAVNVQKVTLDTAVTTATTQAATATTKAADAATAQASATASAAAAVTQATAASSSAAAAATSYANAVVAAAAAGSVAFYANYAAAAAAYAGMAANQVVRVFSDESRGYVSTWYKKGTTALEFMLADSRTGSDPWQSPANYMLGTCAYINQTWRQVEATYDPGSIANNAEIQTAVPLPGAVLGDFVLASTSIDSLGILIDARVSAADTVKVHYRNMTGAAVDLPSHTLTLRLMAKTPD